MTAESTHPADTSKSSPGIDTTQPAGALPEPAFGYEEHGGGAQFSADQMRAYALDYHLEQMRLQGFADGAVSRWAYDSRGEALRESRAETAALMAERDAARLLAEHLKDEWELNRDDIHAFRQEREELTRERDALRRELEELSGQKPVAEVTNAGLLRATASGIALRPMDKLYARPIPSDAREGREPLTEEQIRKQANRDLKHGGSISSYTSGVRFAEKHHGIGPVGTSADGETQP